MKGIKGVATALLSILILPGVAFTEPMTFVTGGMSPPYVYEESGQIIGTDVDTLRLFLKEIGVTPSFTSYPWKRALKNIEIGENHGVFSLLRNPEREAFITFPNTPINAIKTVVVGHVEAPKTVNGLDDLKNLKVGVIMGYQYGPEIDNMEFPREECRDKRHLITLLYHRRVDVILDSEAVFWFNAKKFDFEPEKFKVLYTVRENPIYVGFSKAALGKQAEEMAAKFDAFMQKSGAKN